MANIQRQAVLDYRTTGAQRTTAEVVTLSQALDLQRRRTEAMGPSLRNATAQSGLFGSVQQSAAAKVTSLTNQIGPLGAGLGFIARQAPAAATGLVRLAAGAERQALAFKLLNTTLLAGVGATAAVGVAALAMADNGIRAADTYATLHARIRTFADGAVQAAAAERDLYANARDARASVEGQVTLYTRLAPAVRDYGKSQQDALAITKLVSKAQAIQGADIREQLAATIQFSQSVASGVMRGDELRSLLESAPQLLRYVAANLDLNGKIGVSFSSLRGLGEKGALTTDKIINALLRAGPQIEKDFINAPKTAQQGWQVLTDKITQTVGQVAAVTGAQRGLFDWLARLSDKAEEFRQALLLDPHLLDPVKSATVFIGDALGHVAQLGGVAAEHFDLIVDAGEAIIALKLGHVIAGWFADGARQLQAFNGNMAAMRAQAAQTAAATLNPGAASAATALRGGADGARIRMLDLEAAAQLKVAQALAARRAAEQASLQVSLATQAYGVKHVLTLEAQALATTTLAAAERAETQAKAAQTALGNAATAASTRNAIALEAEALASANVTRATVAKTVATRLAASAYAALGGPLGIATLLLGGLMFALYKSKEAQEADTQAKIAAVAVSDQLESINTRLTAATWAQIPALLAEQQAVLASAAAKREEAAADNERAKAKLALFEAELKKPQSSGEAGQAMIYAAARAERDVARTGRVVNAGAADAFKGQLAVAQSQALAKVQERAEIQDRLSSGVDAAGRTLTPAQRNTLTARSTALQQEGQRAVDAMMDAGTKKSAAINAETDPAKKAALIHDKQADDARQKTYSELATMGATGTPLLPKPPKVPKVSVPGGVNSALQELVAQQYFGGAGKDDYTLKNGLVTNKGGGTFSARSEDEAAAAAKYVKQILAINTATDAQIEKTGKSRDALRQAASAMLAHEVATSKASDAQERWDDLQAEMTGQSREVIKAQRQMSDLMSNNTSITQADTDAYIAWIAARVRAARIEAGLQIANPAVAKSFDMLTAGLVKPTDAHGIVDVAGATAQLTGLREQLISASEARIQQDTAQKQAAGLLTRQEAEKQNADGIAATRLAVDMLLQEQMLALDKERLDESAAYAEQRYGEVADIIVGSLRDIAAGGDIGDVGRDFAQKLLADILDELLFSPMRKQIIDALRSLTDVSGGGGGGFLSSLFKAGVSALTGASSPTFTAPNVAVINNSDIVQRVALSRAGGGWISGPGGPRDDKINARLSNGEFVVNAAAANRHANLLEMINSGREAPRFASGGWIGAQGGGGGGGGGRSVLQPVLQFDLRGAVVTEDLIKQMEAMANSAAAAAGEQAVARSGATAGQHAFKFMRDNHLLR